LAPKYLINTVKPELINEYPFTAYIYFIFFISPQLLVNLSFAIYYTRNANMRRVVFSEAKEYLLLKKDQMCSGRRRK
jgi:hypothetical protein